jgi:hypothetical protein
MAYLIQSNKFSVDYALEFVKENDVDVVDWYNEFNSVEEFCEEFIKVNPMY